MDKPPEEITQKVSRTGNFVRVQVEGKTMRVTALTPDGTKLDRFEVAGGAR